MKSGISWRAKLEKGEHKIIHLEPGSKMAKKWGAGRMVIARPLDVDALIRQVPKGKLITVSYLRERLARDYCVDLTCPITTGIFVRIAAEAAEEDLRAGKADITPYWRVIHPDGSLNEKFPGGPPAQAARLVAEGHTLEPGRGQKPPQVKDYENSLWLLSKIKGQF